jgi:hypothetical protein
VDFLFSEGKSFDSDGLIFYSFSLDQLLVSTFDDGDFFFAAENAAADGGFDCDVDVVAGDDAAVDAPLPQKGNGGHRFFFESVFEEQQTEHFDILDEVVSAFVGPSLKIFGLDFFVSISDGPESSIADVLQ